MRRGDAAAFAELFGRHQGSIFRYAMHMCGPSAADDVVQDTFLALIRQLHSTARTCAPAQGAERGEAAPASDRAGVWGGAPHGYDRARGTVGAYLFGIARHHVMKRLGDCGLRNADCGLIDDSRLENQQSATSNQQLSPLADLERAESIALVRDAVRSLPPVYREVVVLCELQEMDYADAAAVLECPIGTVRSRLHRGRALLAQKLIAMRESTSVER